MVGVAFKYEYQIASFFQLRVSWPETIIRPAYLGSSITLELLDLLPTLFKERYLLGSLFVPVSVMLAISNWAPCWAPRQIQVLECKKESSPNSRCEGLNHVLGSSVISKIFEVHWHTQENNFVESSDPKKKKKILNLRITFQKAAQTCESRHLIIKWMNSVWYFLASTLF